MRKYLLIALLGLSVAIAARPLRFAQISDTHIQPNHHSVSDLQQTVRAINDLDSIDFVLLTGDITHRGDSLSFAIAKNILDSLNVPYFIVSGNHDTKFDPASIRLFERTFGYSHFVLDTAGYVFVGINTGQLGTSQGLVSENEVQWLDSVCANIESNKIIFLCTHHPPQQGDIANPEPVAEIIDQRHIDYILSGHYHLNMIFACGERPCVTTRTNQSSQFAASGFSIIEIGKDMITWTEHTNTQPSNTWLELPLTKK